MNTLMTKKTKWRKSHIPTTALITEVAFDEEMMTVYLTDGRILSTPLIWFPVLYEATPEQRLNFEISGGGFSLHWDELDEDISIAHLMAGVNWQAA